jgi:uncharacterized protein (DUF58 family)
MKYKLQLNVKAFPVVAVIAFIMQIIDPSRVWIILLIGFGGTWLFCHWWVRGLAHSLHLKRELRYGWAQVGDNLEERFTLVNDFILPATWVVIHDHSTLPDHHASVAIGVDSRNKTQWKLLNQCTQRGVFTLGGTTIESGDPFGLYTIAIKDETSSIMAVMPPVVPLPRFNILSSGWAGNGRTNPRSLEETINASHTREMVQGDPLKLIHWKTTARRGSFHVHQPDGTHAGDWWILLDLDKKIQIGRGWDSTVEHGVILAASLISLGLEEDHSVGLAINGREPAWHVPRNSGYQDRSLMKSLAVATPSKVNLKDYLQRNSKAFGQRCSLLIITANTESDWSESLMPLMWRGILPTVFLLDVNTFGGSAKIDKATDLFRSLGVPCHVIPRGLLDKPQARPGREGMWKWRITGTGRAVAVQKPISDWRELG